MAVGVRKKLPSSSYTHAISDRDAQSRINSINPDWKHARQSSTFSRRNCVTTNGLVIRILRESSYQERHLVRLGPWREHVNALCRRHHRLGAITANDGGQPMDVIFAVDDGAAHVAVRAAFLVLPMHEIA